MWKLKIYKGNPAKIGAIRGSCVVARVFIANLCL